MKRGWFILILALLALVIAISSCANKWTTSGKIAYNRKDYDKAIEDFQLAVKADSANAEAYYYLGKAYKEKGNFIAMARNFDKAAALNPKYKEEIDRDKLGVWGDMFNAGTRDAKEEKFDQALKDFQGAIAVLPDKYQAYTNAGYVWQKLNKDDSAFVYYGKAYELNKKEPKTDVKLFENYAGLAFNTEKYQLADSLYVSILDADPNNADAWMRRGLIADHDSSFDEAVADYNKSLQINPQQCDAWFNLGVIYFQRMQKMEDAEQAFSRAADQCPDDINAIVNLSIVQISLGQNDPAKLDQAIERLTALTQKTPSECVGWDLLSQALLRRGEKAKALDANKQYEACKQGK